MSARDLATFAADKYQLPLLDLSQFNFATVPPAWSATASSTPTGCCRWAGATTGWSWQPPIRPTVPASMPSARN